MPTTLSDVIRRSRSVIDEPTTAFWTDTEITDWINDGARDIARRAEELLNFSTSINAVAGVATYSLPSDIIRVHRMEFVPLNSTQTYPIQASSYQEMDQVWGINQLIQSSYPSFFVIRGYPGGSQSGTSDSRLMAQFYPVPAQSGTFNIFYYRLPYRFLDPIANTQELTKPVELPEGWDDLLVMYAEFNALRKGREERWKDAKAMYEEKVDQLINVTRDYHDQGHYFITANRTNVPSWLYSFGDD